MIKANVNLREEVYVSPAIAVVEISAEGVLCASGQLEGWEDGDKFTWDE